MKSPTAKAFGLSPKEGECAGTCWHRAYFVGSVGGATLETVRATVDAQGTEEHARKAVAKTKAKRKPPA